MDDECNHQDNEECMTCIQCGKCKEDIDSEDICTECKQEVLSDLLNIT